MGFIQAFEMLAGTALRLEVTIETQAVTGSLPSGPCIGQSAPFRPKLSEDCLPGRQPPAETEKHLPRRHFRLEPADNQPFPG